MRSVRSSSSLLWIVALVAAASLDRTEAITVREFVQSLRESVTAILIHPLDKNDTTAAQDANDNDSVLIVEDAWAAPALLYGQSNGTASEPTAFVCPEQQGDWICSTEWAPVLCDGLCQYGNFCEAAAAGYEDGDARCVSYDPYAETTEPCPTMQPGTFCSMYWEPFICDERCTYGNRCEASMAGFDVATRCRPDDF
jgi:hypothetical protein